MAFTVSETTRSDLTPMIKGEFLAFAQDPGLKSTFPKGPSPTTLAYYDAIQWKELFADPLGDPTQRHIVARDKESGQVVGSAAWHIFPPDPSSDWKDEAELKHKLQEMVQEFQFPEDANHEMGKRYFGDAMEQRLRSMKEDSKTTVYVFLEVIATHPDFQKRGIGYNLVRWGTSYADTQDPPLPCYLEATAAGKPVYARAGFEERERSLRDLRPYHDEVREQLNMLKAIGERKGEVTATAYGFFNVGMVRTATGVAGN